eukprot:CAMPEP_0202966942 /NCGR_PEP_ID=MMETSP1396-20130829/11608_1 /ASSEMBLY_ACC=CAM_ASM_000872 /TAXON_ID= /ORGANISM="Pseudokeronopsis sp., Strain Brazil" /LENGTH=53 /DNA_ID=CAMNT_0049691405 /DNA_START=750 /DNA_END=911 /DNA_ORIENTATION=+
MRKIVWDEKRKENEIKQKINEKLYNEWLEMKKYDSKKMKIMKKQALREMERER